MLQIIQIRLANRTCWLSSQEETSKCCWRIIRKRHIGISLMTSPNEGFYIPFLPCSCCQCWKQSPNKEILRDRNVPVTAISSLLRRAWICVTSDSLSMRIAILTISVVPGRYQYYYHEANDKLSFHSHIPFGGVCSWSGNCLDMTSSYGKNVSATSSSLLPAYVTSYIRQPSRRMECTELIYGEYQLCQDRVKCSPQISYLRCFETMGRSILIRASVGIEIMSI